MQHGVHNFQKMSALDFCQISGACFYKIALITLGVYFKRIKNPSFHSTWCTSFQIEGARLPYFRAWVHLKSMLRILKTSLGSPEKYAQNSKDFHKGFSNYLIKDQCSLNPFLHNVPILYPLKTPENLWFSGVFRGYELGTLARNGLMLRGTFVVNELRGCSVNV